MVKITEAESRMVAARGRGDVGVGSCCSLGEKFQLCKMRRF